MASVSTVLGDLPSGADGELTNSPPPWPVEGWVNLCDAAGKIQARFHPVDLLIVIQHRNQRTVHKLSDYRTGLDFAKQL